MGNLISQGGWPVNAWMVIVAKVIAVASSAGLNETCSNQNLFCLWVNYVQSKET